MYKELIKWAQEKAEWDKSIVDHQLFTVEKELREHLKWFFHNGEIYDLNKIHECVDRRIEIKNRIKFMNRVIFDLHGLGIKFRYRKY